MHGTHAFGKHAAGEVDLVQHFFVVGDPTLVGANADARPEVALQRVFTLPPAQQVRECLSLFIDGPVELGREIIDPSLVQPKFGICIELFVLVKSGNGGWIARTPDAEGAQAKLDMFFLLFDLSIEPFDQFVDPIPSPVSPGKRTTAVEIGSPALVVRKILVAIVRWVWIEIIVK